jgi:hypothetical protein
LVLLRCGLTSRRNQKERTKRCYQDFTHSYASSLQ